MAIEQNVLKSIMRSIHVKRKPHTAEDIERRHEELREQSKRTCLIMQTIAHIVYVQRVNRYEAQGVVRIGRNDLCPCGSGKKFKNCRMNKMRSSNAENN